MSANQVDIAAVREYLKNMASGTPADRAKLRALLNDECFVTGLSLDGADGKAAIAEATRKTVVDQGKDADDEGDEGEAYEPTAAEEADASCDDDDGDGEDDK